MLYALILLFILQGIGFYYVFEKANQADWKGFIPFYNWFIVLKITNNNNYKNYTNDKSLMLYLLFLMCFASNLASIMQHPPTGYRLSAQIVVSSFAWPLILYDLLYDLAKCFQKNSLGFVLGLIFLFPVFGLILGLSKAQYTDPRELETKGAHPNA